MLLTVSVAIWQLSAPLLTYPPPSALALVGGQECEVPVDGRCA